jgi:hypothetical protein
MQCANCKNLYPSYKSGSNCYCDKKNQFVSPSTPQCEDYEYEYRSSDELNELLGTPWMAALIGALLGVPTEPEKQTKPIDTTPAYLKPRELLHSFELMTRGAGYKDSPQFKYSFTHITGVLYQYYSVGTLNDIDDILWIRIHNLSWYPEFKEKCEEILKQSCNLIYAGTGNVPQAIYKEWLIFLKKMYNYEPLQLQNSYNQQPEIDRLFLGKTK